MGVEASLRIFISHSSKDLVFVRRLAQDLRQALGNEQTVWYDAHDLRGGDAWWRKIIEELRRSSIFLVVLSPNAVASDWVNDEIDIAWRLKNSPIKMRLIPLLYQSCDVRYDLKSFHIIHFLDTRPYEEALQETLEALKHSVAGVGSAQVPSEPITATYPEHVLVQHHRPKEYLPIRSRRFFLPRPHEFERFEKLLFEPAREQVTTSPVRVAIIGMGGVGKSQLAVELANRYRSHFPDGIFWTEATGESDIEWQQRLAKLAAHVEYFPPDDDIFNPEYQERRARHLCRYLAEHPASLLILDNVNAPHSIIPSLTNLAGMELRCIIMYTSRYRTVPDDYVVYNVEALPEDVALRLLLEGQHSMLLSSILTDKPKDAEMDAETDAARKACQMVGYLPLAIMHFRGVLRYQRTLTLVQLVKSLQKRGTLAVAQRSMLPVVC